MNSFWIEGVGIFGPGLANWAQAVEVFSGRAAYTPVDVPKLAPALLPADVRRRTTEHIRLAVEVGAEAVRQAEVDAGALRSVFASSESDGAITHNICEEVARDKPEVSPTRFHNSVNNAAAGYWCMAVQSRAPSTSVAGFDASFGVGLVEAVVQVLGENERVLLIAHDTLMPEPLNTVRPMSAIFGCALVLAPQPGAHSIARVTLSVDPTLVAPSRLGVAALDGLRTTNPAARALPLLSAIACRSGGDLVLPYVYAQSLRLHMEMA